MGITIMVPGTVPATIWIERFIQHVDKKRKVHILTRVRQFPAGMQNPIKFVSTPSQVSGVETASPKEMSYLTFDPFDHSQLFRGIAISYTG